MYPFGERLYFQIRPQVFNDPALKVRKGL